MRHSILAQFRLTAGSAATAAVPFHRVSDVPAFSFNALHHKNKLNKAQDCCCVITSITLLEKASPVMGQVFKKCQNFIYR